MPDILSLNLAQVSTPYVNHVPTMTGGVGYQDLARFYKVSRQRTRLAHAHRGRAFTSVPLRSRKRRVTGSRTDIGSRLLTLSQITPPDTELITISRTSACSFCLPSSVDRLEARSKLTSAAIVGADRVIDEMIFKCTHTTVCICADNVRADERLLNVDIPGNRLLLAGHQTYGQAVGNRARRRRCLPGRQADV